MSENTFYLSLLTTFFLGIALIVGISCHHFRAKDQQMIEAGYIQRQVPTMYSAEWVKPEAK